MNIPIPWTRGRIFSRRGSPGRALRREVLYIVRRLLFPLCRQAEIHFSSLSCAGGVKRIFHRVDRCLSPKKEGVAPPLSIMRTASLCPSCDGPRAPDDRPWSSCARGNHDSSYAYDCSADKFSSRRMPPSPSIFGRKIPLSITINDSSR